MFKATAPRNGRQSVSTPMGIGTALEGDGDVRSRCDLQEVWMPLPGDRPAARRSVCAAYGAGAWELVLPLFGEQQCGVGGSGSAGGGSPPRAQGGGPGGGG